MPVKATVHSMGHFDILQCQIVYNIEEIEFQYHKIGSDVTIRFRKASRGRILSGEHESELYM